MDCIHAIFLYILQGYHITIHFIVGQWVKVRWIVEWHWSMLVKTHSGDFVPGSVLLSARDEEGIWRHDVIYNCLFTIWLFIVTVKDRGKNYQGQGWTCDELIQSSHSRQKMRQGHSVSDRTKRKGLIFQDLWLLQYSFWNRQLQIQDFFPLDVKDCVNGCDCMGMCLTLSSYYQQQVGLQQVIISIIH